MFLLRLFGRDSKAITFCYDLCGKQVMSARVGPAQLTYAEELFPRIRSAVWTALAASFELWDTNMSQLAKGYEQCRTGWRI